MPKAIEIVEAFTRWVDLKPQAGIDGIEVYVQPQSFAGEPIRASGAMLVELYAFKKASGDPKGPRVEFWSIPLETEADQEAHWNRATEMYQFRLELSPSAPPLTPGDRFILLVTHNSPLGGHQSDEMVLEVPLARRVPDGNR